MISRTVTLPADLQSMIDLEMARGDYADFPDLLRQALHHWAEHRETVQAIDEAIEQSEAGLGRPWEQVDQEFRERYGLPPRQ